MKQLLLTLLFGPCISIAFSQTINFGIKAGLNLSELTYTNSAVNGHSTLPGFNAGGIVDIGFGNFSIQPGIFYSTKGERDAKEFLGPGGGGTDYIPSRVELDYIEVPVNFLYKVKLSPAATLNLGGGAYFAYGVSGSLKLSINTPSNYMDVNHYPYQNPDYGINFIAGLTVKNKWLIDAGYGIGLQNLQTPNTMRNRVISFSLGYLFK